MDIAYIIIEADVSFKSFEGQHYLQRVSYQTYKTDLSKKDRVKEILSKTTSYIRRNAYRVHFSQETIVYASEQ